MQTGPTKTHAKATRLAFTLVDLMVSMAVVAILFAMLTPAVRMARNAAQRSACASNVRQQGLASQMYAYDRGGKIPTSVFSAKDSTYQYAPSETVLLRVSPASKLFVGSGTSKNIEKWDGLGFLYKYEYVEAPEVFYCPRQTSQHTIDRYRPNFQGTPGEIVGNYQLRLADPKRYMSDLDPAMALIANSMRTVDEYSHKTGNNMLLADMSVQWFSDGLRLMGYLHPLSRNDSRGSEESVESAWKFLDQRRVPVEASDDGTHKSSGDPSNNDIDKTKKAGRLDDRSLSVRSNRPAICARSASAAPPTS